MSHRILSLAACLVALAVPLSLVAAVAAPAAASLAPIAVGAGGLTAGPAFQAPEPQKDIKIDVDINRGGGRWYVNPVWIAIGVIALVVLVLLVAMAVRGGGETTVVK